ncbi:MAG: hypothetical protein E7557_00980 [Ruminococcaceae bacterium]|nr:hypothetical protein [Oscillospiraceae bacterium]
MKKLGFTKKRLLAFLFTLILPVFSLICGSILLMSDCLINLSFLLTFIIFPVLTIIALGFTIFYNTKTLLKVFFSTLLTILFALLLSVGYIYGEYVMLWHYEDEMLEAEYSEIAETKKLMPTLDEVGSPVDIDYYNVYIQYFIYFTPETDYLICEYTPEEYKTQKNALFEKFIFQEDKLSNLDASCEATTELDGFTFRSLSIDEKSYKSSIDYPKQMMLIAYSDKTNEIIYISFYDDDIDYLTSLSEFINDDCGWKYIRKYILTK